MIASGRRIVNGGARYESCSLCLQRVRSVRCTASGNVRGPVISMSGSSVRVAVNAVGLKRLRLPTRGTDGY
jgi:hypothetical protein